MNLSLKSYGWKRALGSEIIYFVCLLGGFLPLRSVEATQLHHLFFETLPGFSWLDAGSVILGAIYFFIFAWIFAWYFVWMHNSGLIKQRL